MEAATFEVLPPTVSGFFVDLERLRAMPTAGDPAIVEQVLTMLRVGKPPKEAFVRVHPEHRIDAFLLELKEDATTLLVAPTLQPALTGEPCVGIRRLQLAVTATGVPFIWPLRLPNENRKDTWASTALDAAAMAVDTWVRVTANMSLGGYQIAIARINNEPKWPKESFNDLLRIAFKGFVVDSLDHPVLKKLRGEPL